MTRTTLFRTVRPLSALRVRPALTSAHLNLPSRSQSSSSSSSSSSGSTKDPSHPHLWYHPYPSLPSSSSLALSFLPSPPSTNSRTILGLISPGAAGPGDFQENRQFIQVLHEAIKDGLSKGKGIGAEFEASGRPGDGYIHITDERAIPPAGRIGETEDLIGSVFVENGKIVASTYEPLPSYRLITSNGPLLLPQGLDEHLIQELERIDAEEKAGTR